MAATVRAGPSGRSLLGEVSAWPVATRLAAVAESPRLLVKRATMNGGDLSLGDLAQRSGATSPDVVVDISRELDSLGLVLEPGPAGFVVRLVRAGSSAEHSGQVQRGDRVTQYNSVSVQLAQGAPVVHRHGVRNGKFVFLRVEKDDGTFVECAIERDPTASPKPNGVDGLEPGKAHREHGLPYSVAPPAERAAQTWSSSSLKVDRTTRPPSAVEKSCLGVRSPIRSINKGLGKMRWKALGEDGSLPASPALSTRNLTCDANSIRNRAAQAGSSAKSMGYAPHSTFGSREENANLT